MTRMSTARRDFEKSKYAAREQGRDDTDSRIVWTKCPKCGDTWTTLAVSSKGKCPVCHGQVKVQKRVF